MRPSLVDDDLWELIKPLLPDTTRRYRHPDRRRIDDRKVLNGILFVLDALSKLTERTHQAAASSTSFVTVRQFRVVAATPSCFSK